MKNRHLFKKLVALSGLAVVTGKAFGAISSNNLQVYYTYDSGTVTSTVVTDQWTADGNANNIGRTALSSFGSGAKFGDALNVSTQAGTPRSASDASIVNSFLPGTSDYTLSFWYRQGAGTNRIFGAGARTNDVNNDDGLQIYKLGTTGFEVAFHDPSLGATTRDGFTTGAAGTFDGNSWNLFTLVRESTSIALWVNGTNVGSTTLASGYNIAVNTGTYFREASFGPDTAVTAAAYDDTAVFKRALSAAEIGQIWNGGSGATIASLIPEPSSAAILGGIGVLALMRRRR